MVTTHYMHQSTPPPSPAPNFPYTPPPTKTEDVRVVGRNKHGKEWLCKDFEKRNGEWWVISLNCKVADCFASHYLDNLNSGACN